MKKIIELKNISLVYETFSQKIKALENINFNVYKNEFLSIVGPSGCGKSTILLLISNLKKASSGQILVNDPKNNEKNFIGLNLQKDNLLPWRSVKQNVILGLEIKKILSKENMSLVDDLLFKYGLNNFLDCKPSELSGGMRQKVALIRTLALSPEVLLLDEPFSALDFHSKIIISDEIKSILKKEKKTVILVTHDIQEAISFSDRIIILTKSPGKVKEIVNINLEETSTLERRKNKFFNQYFEKIWKQIE